MSVKGRTESGARRFGGWFEIDVGRPGLGYVARRYLPGAIVDRPKSGFGVPVASWLRGDGPISALVSRVISSPAITDILKRDVLAESFAVHRSGARDHSEFLWGVLNLGLWREAYSC